jgi:hypothetical protein
MPTTRGFDYFQNFEIENHTTLEIGFRFNPNPLSLKGRGN